VHATSFRGNGDIDPVVHQHASRGAVDSPHDVANQRYQLGGFKVGLSNLDVIDAGPGGCAELLTQQLEPIGRACPHRRAQPPAIGHQAEDHCRWLMSDC
jgi:hypothetical protein